MYISGGLPLHWWWHSVVVSTMASINVVNRHWARLVLGWVTARGHVNRPSRSTQPSTLCGMVKWASAFGLSNNKWRWWK